MFHRAPVMHHLQSSVLTLGGDPCETTTEHPDAVAQKRAVGGVVNITFDDRRVGSKFASLCYTLLTRKPPTPRWIWLVVCGPHNAEGRPKGEELGVASAFKPVEARDHRLLPKSRSRSRKVQP